jgi:uncharacterized membrane protein YqgA involved in biofilm formation
MSAGTNPDARSVSGRVGDGRAPGDRDAVGPEQAPAKTSATAIALRRCMAFTLAGAPVLGGLLACRAVRGLGTVINLVTVALGGSAGVLLGDRLPESMRRTIMQGLGLVTIAVAIGGLEPLYDADRGLRRFVILIASIILGGLIGEYLRLEERLEVAGETLRRRFGAPNRRPGARGGSGFVEGFVTASTIFCVGPLTELGAVEDGLGGSIRLLVVKSALDGFAAIGLASVFGVGVLASLLTIAALQGALTLLAFAIEPILSGEALAELGAVGSLLILGIGLRLMDIVRVRVLNLLPAVLLGAVAAGLVDLIL